MRVLVTGSNGLIGRAVLAFLTAEGHTVFCLTRPQSRHQDRMIHWDPVAGSINKGELENFDAVVHLAGETIVGRWTPAKKARILDSRVKGTRLLCESLANLNERPPVLVAASAVGYYGDGGDKLMTEESSVGSLYLSGVTKAWEEATWPARASGIRVVNLRIGFVLSKASGGLAAMLLPFKLGLGGRVGSGRQYLSWIAIDDVVGVIAHAIRTDTLHGPVNAVAPNPVTNREFTKALGSVLGRPTIFPMPVFAAHLAMGEMADNLLLASARVDPVRLRETAYEFKCPDIRGALRHVLGRN